MNEITLFVPDFDLFKAIDKADALRDEIPECCIVWVEGL